MGAVLGGRVRGGWVPPNGATVESAGRWQENLMYTAAQGFTGRIFNGPRIRSLDSLRRIQGAGFGGQPLGSNPGASFRLIPSVVWCDWCPQHSAPMTPAWPDLGTPSAPRGGLTPRVAPRRESPRAAPPRPHFADALRSAPTAHNHAYTPRWTNSLIPSVVWCDWHPQHSAAMPPARPVLGTLLAPRGGLTPRMAPRRLRKLDVRRRTTAAGP